MSSGHWLFGIVVLVAMLYPYIRIIRRAGYSGWWFLTMFVPIVNIVMLWVFAFAQWPALNRPDR
ncbi:hypothetical protein [Paraburkholderia sp. NMBU_R16]|uniref:hypothetical protein n=1 Tax=Paraburkholderia sp. NMBU_R16 TaxID=2698676 RepID=UPI0020B7CE34|nr:hypothetical protein [Paraburkholderia sp. NMBU_R16]